METWSAIEFTCWLSVWLYRAHTISFTWGWILYRMKVYPVGPVGLLSQKGSANKGETKTPSQIKPTKIIITQSYSEYLWSWHGICQALRFCIFLEMTVLSQSERNAKILTNYLWDNQLFYTVNLRLNIMKCLLVEQAQQWSNSFWNGMKPRSWMEKALNENNSLTQTQWCSIYPGTIELSSKTLHETENNLYIVTGLKQKGLELQVLSSTVFTKQQTVIEVIKSKKDGCVLAFRRYRASEVPCVPSFPCSCNTAFLLHCCPGPA